MPVVSPQPIEQALRLMGRAVRRSRERVYFGLNSPLRHHPPTTQLASRQWVVRERVVRSSDTSVTMAKPWSLAFSGRVKPRNRPLVSTCFLRALPLCGWTTLRTRSPARPPCRSENLLCGGGGCGHSGIAPTSGLIGRSTKYRPSMRGMSTSCVRESMCYIEAHG